jgi:hypothetical protein
MATGPDRDLLDVFLTLSLGFAALWALLWLTVPLFYATMAFYPVAGMVGLGLHVDLWKSYVGAEVAAIQLALMAWAILLALVSLVIIWRANKENLLILHKGMYATLVLALTGVLLLVRYMAPRDLSVPGTIALLCATLIPAVPFAAVPLAIQWYRHR